MQGTLPSIESAEVHGDVFTVLIHDLGAIASALSLRTEVLADILPAPDHAALKTLAGQISDIKRTLRMVQGPRGTQSLSPEQTMTGEQWWRLASRLAGSLLPRGLVVQSQLGVTQLTSMQAHVLLYLWMTAGKDLPVNGERLPLSLHVSLAARNVDGTGTLITATVQSSAVDAGAVEAGAVPTTRSRWLRYAQRVARRNGAELDWWKLAGSIWTWRCSIG